MAKFKTLSFRCPDCSIVEHYTEDVDAVEKHTCLACGSEMQQTIGAPRVLEHTFVDGRKREDAYYIEKQARKLEASTYDLPPEKRQDTLKEVKKLRKEIK